MEESQNLMWLKRKQMLKSNIQVPFGVSYNNNNNSWEERAFAEDAARILGGCIWPPRSYSCNFCKREFRSAQALGGHMNVHRRDRARLKQSLGQLNHEALHSQYKNDFTSSRFSTSWPSTILTEENCFHSSSNISWGNHKECPNSEPKGIVVNNAREQIFKGYYGCNDYVETSLSVGQNLMFGQKLSTGDDSDTSYKRSKTSSICSSGDDRLKSFQSAEFVLGLKPGMEDLDLELRLGKTQKV